MLLLMLLFVNDDVVGCIPNQSLALTSYSFAAALAAQLLHRSIFKYALFAVVADHVVVVVVVVFN